MSYSPDGPPCQSLCERDAAVIRRSHLIKETIFIISFFLYWEIPGGKSNSAAGLVSLGGTSPLLVAWRSRTVFHFQSLDLK